MGSAFVALYLIQHSRENCIWQLIQLVTRFTLIEQKNNKQENHRLSPISVIRIYHNIILMLFNTHIASGLLDRCKEKEVYVVYKYDPRNIVSDADSMKEIWWKYKERLLNVQQQLLCKLCRTSPPPAMGARFTVFLACRSCGPAGWLALLLTKAGDVETNPGPTTLNKKVWICDICHKQIHVRKQISIRCNRIEHWVHLRCAGIRQAQYTDS